jgi:transcriptional regulator with XRE-family HTH domain
MSAADLALKLGVCRSAVAMYERGEREPPLDRLVRIAQIFGVDPNYLLGFEPEHKEDNVLDNVLDNLKETLFNETLRALNRERLTRPTYGAATLRCDTPEHDKALAAFTALYDVIEVAGLEAEYAQWRRKEAK